MSLRSLALISSLALGLIACDDATPPGDGDGGLDASVEVDAGAVYTCEGEMEQVTGVIDDTVNVTVDTSMVAETPRDLGLGCGNDEAELRWAPQSVIEFTTPGDPSRTYAVEFTTNTPGTATDFNTVVQVRDSCAQVPSPPFPPRCFDDVAAGEFRSTGAVTVPGGTVLYFLVTGYSDPPAEQETVDQGVAEVAFTVRGGEPPEVTGGFLRLALDDVRIELTGTDPDANVRGVAMNFYGPEGLLDIYGDGEATEDGDIFVVRFDEPPATGFDWTGGAWVRSDEVNLGPYLRAVSATAVQFRVFDAAWGISDPLMVPIDEATLVGLGETCDDESFCRPELACSTGSCIPSSQIARVCDGAAELVVPATPNMGATVTMMGSTGEGPGVVAVDAMCSPNPNAGIGQETAYKVDVAIDRFDMQITTDLPGSGTTDTILYVRSACPDSGTTLACNDDVDAAAMNFQSEIELTDLAAGTYYVFVEQWGGSGTGMGSPPHEIGVTLTPVVPSGEVCDEATTRCASGMACTAGMCP